MNAAIRQPIAPIEDPFGPDYKNCQEARLIQNLLMTPSLLNQSKKEDDAQALGAELAEPDQTIAPTFTF